MTTWPVPLRPGDRVALVAPCGVVEPASVEAGAAALRSRGFDPVEMPHVRRRHGHTAGTDEERLADLQAALSDSQVRAIWAVRGGYGATRLVGRVDWTPLRADPRWVVGLSDMTALHHDLWRHTGVVSCHGHGAGRLDHLEAHPDAADHLWALVTGAWRSGTLPHLADTGSPRRLAGGRARGPLLGGNLALLCAGVGTPNQLDTTGAVLFLEDVNEMPYRLDRMLTQLRAAGMLDEVAAVVLGRFVGCDARPGVPSATVDEVVADRLGDLGIPILADLPIGHQTRHLALPHGARVEVDADVGTLRVLTN